MKHASTKFRMSTIASISALLGAALLSVGVANGQSIAPAGLASHQDRGCRSPHRVVHSAE